ncbi:MAG: hypothetical protein LUE27_05555 [Clostridia bacterium]|nr:hypothetical protein [Clostridia bacterium]
MAKARRASVDVTYNGANVTTKLADYLASFSYTDISSGSSDSISLQVNDRDRKWINAWLPEKGDKMTVKVKLKNWTDAGDKSLSCGSYVIDDFSISGTPIKLKIEAVATPADSSFKETSRTQTYENTTLENIGQEIAGRAGINFYYEAERVDIGAVEQSEQDDCEFYNNLVTTYGYAMKIYKDKIVVFSEATYETKPAVATLTESDIEPNWEWNTTLCQTYTGAKYEYTNSDTNQTFVASTGVTTPESSARVLKVTDAASSLAEGKQIMLAKLNDANKEDTTMSVTLALPDPAIIATSCVKISGLGKINGKYYVEQVDWSVGGNGATTQKLTMRLIGSRFESASGLATEVATSSGTETSSSTSSTTDASGTVDVSTLSKGDSYTLTETKKGYYTAAEALAGKATGGHPTGTRKAGTYIIYNISQGMLNLTTVSGTPGSWINPN